jgi:hypothetical protein
MSNGKEAKDLVAKKLATGEIAIWDETERLVILLSQTEKDPSVRIISGATLIALEAALGSIVVLV